MKSQSPHNYNYIIYWALFISVVVGLGYSFFTYPKMFEDWEFYLEFLYKGADSDGHHSLWHGIKESLFKLDRYSSIRIGNTIGPLLLLVPRWIPSLVTTIFFAFAYWLMAVLSGVKIGQWVKLSFLTFLLLFAFNWAERMFCQMYAYNYIVTIPIFLYAVKIFIEKKHFGIAEAVIIGLLISLWHESFGVAFLGGSILTLFFMPEYRTKERYVLTAASFAGLLIMLLLPSLWKRKENVFALVMYKPALVYLWGCVAALSLLVYCSLKKAKRHIIYNPLTIFTLVSCIGLIPLVFVTTFVRIAIPAMVLSIIFLIKVSGELWPSIYSLKKILPVSFAIVLVLLSGIHILAVGFETKKYKAIVEEAMDVAMDNNNRSDVVFTTIVYPWYNPWIALGRPERDFLTNSSSSNTLWYIRNVANNYNLNFLPKELKEYQKGYGRKIDGHNNFRIWKGHLVSDNISDTEYKWANVYYSNYKDVAPIDNAVFIGKDGKEYVYTVAKRSFISRFKKDPIAVDYDVQL